VEVPKCLVDEVLVPCCEADMVRATPSPESQKR
jgi:hypothetical protein